MTKSTVTQTIEKMRKQGWELDRYSTILSRRHSRHCAIGPLRFTKPLKERTQK
jgi:hypothetical protein